MGFAFKRQLLAGWPRASYSISLCLKNGRYTSTCHQACYQILKSHRGTWKSLNTVPGAQEALKNVNDNDDDDAAFVPLSVWASGYLSGPAIETLQ